MVIESIRLGTLPPLDLVQQARMRAKLLTEMENIAAQLEQCPRLMQQAELVPASAVGFRSGSDSIAP